MRITAGTVALTLALCGGAAAQDVKLGPVDGRDLPPTDLDRVAVGANAPDFTLPKYGGGTVTLSELRGRNVVLVFYRGYWCPYCITQLRELRDLLDPELKKNTDLLVLSVDGEAQTRMSVTRIAREDGRQPDYAFLMDTDNAVIARYGVLNPDGSRRGIPHPAVYVIDTAGTVRWKDIQTDYKIRPPNEQILAALRALGG
jgi:peroxiredoxin